MKAISSPAEDGDGSSNSNDDMVVVGDTVVVEGVVQEILDADTDTGRHSCQAAGTEGYAITLSASYCVELTIGQFNRHRKISHFATPVWCLAQNPESLALASRGALPTIEKTDRS
jgi:hypothetical protein